MGSCAQQLVRISQVTTSGICFFQGTHHTRNHSVQLSTKRAHASTTQYMSHGVSCAGSEVLSAL